MVAIEERTAGHAAPLAEGARLADHLVRHIQDTLGAAPGLLAETSAYVLSSPGKLLRPQLLLDACRAAGGDPALAFPAAAGTEYGHIASLIHDDIIDGDAERRGQTALHVKYDLGTAILTGDFLIFQTFLSYTECLEQGVSAERVLAAIRTLSVTCLEMCQGQALEASIAGRLDTSEATYLEMIRLKTASLCRAAARIGALMGGAPEEAIEAVGLYGENLGLAFQIVDDLLCYEGHAARVGKPLGSDLHNGRVTLPVIYALEDGDDALRERVARLFAGGEGDEMAAHARLHDILRATGALERARGRAARYAARATASLDRLPSSESRERLRAVATTVLTRDH